MQPVQERGLPIQTSRHFILIFLFNYIGDSLVIDTAVYEKWRANMPVYMIDKYAGNLKKLKASNLIGGEMMQAVLLCSVACSARS